MTKDLTDDERYEKLINCSGKMILLDKIVKKFLKEKKKMLIFSQFTYILVLLEEYLRHNYIKYEKIDGSVKSRDRQNAIDRFNKPE
jgi:chromodomain-helicase-DNA-binding protein 7